VPSTLPSTAFAVPGTVATNFVDTGKLAVATTTSVLSSCHFASRAISGESVMGGVAATVPTALAATIGRENASTIRTWPSTSPVGDPATVRSPFLAAFPPHATTPPNSVTRTSTQLRSSMLRPRPHYARHGSGIRSACARRP